MLVSGPSGILVIAEPNVYRSVRKFRGVTAGCEGPCDNSVSIAQQAMTWPGK